MTAVVWSHEFNNVGLTVCFDPADPVWNERRQAYRSALQAIPTIDGVVLMFGSATLEPWYGWAPTPPSPHLLDAAR